MTGAAPSARDRTTARGAIAALRRLASVGEVRRAAAAAALFAAGGLARAVGAPAAVSWVGLVAAVVVGGWGPLVDGLRAARAGTLDVDLLMVVAAVAAIAIGQPVDAALLVVIFASSGALESVATRRTEDSVRALLEVAPERATRLAPAPAAGSGEPSRRSEEEVDVADLVVGDVVVVRPGERIGADGTVVNGGGEVDQASVTGEPLPVDRGPGDAVFAGTINGTGSLRVRVDRPAAESVVARIVAQVERAAATKARRQLLVERVEQRYSVAVVVATLALGTVPPALGSPLEPTLLRAMTFMIVASPCAVVLATMPPLLAAMATAGRHGVLVRSAVVMERLGGTDVVAFDKTGTLTDGAPRVLAVEPVPDPGGGAAAADDVLALAAAAEDPSEHPVARAVVAAARDRGLVVLPSTAFTSSPGRGVAATVDGRRVEVGAPTLLPDAAPRTPAARRRVADREEAGHTAVVVLADGVPVGVLALGDRVRESAAPAVTALRTRTGAGAAVLTGDNPRAAHHVAAEAGIDDVRAGLLPAGKVDAVRDLQTGGRQVMVVGDGVNDAPALATADVGVALGRRGADLALETADAVLVHDDLTAVPAVVALSRRARRLTTANLVAAAVVVVGLVTWDLVGTLPLPLGVAGHEGSTVLVALNGLRLLGARAWPGVSAAGTQPARAAATTAAATRATSSTPVT